MSSFTKRKQLDEDSDPEYNPYGDDADDGNNDSISARRRKRQQKLKQRHRQQRQNNDNGDSGSNSDSDSNSNSDCTDDSQSQRQAQEKRDQRSPLPKKGRTSNPTTITIHDLNADIDPLNLTEASANRLVGKSNRTLRPYQIHGVQWMLSKAFGPQQTPPTTTTTTPMTLQVLGRGGGILADEMGLGKTIQSIGWMSAVKAVLPRSRFLIVAPVSCCNNWLQEINNHSSNLSATLYSGSREAREQLRENLIQDAKSNDGLLTFTCIIASYETVNRDLELFFERYTWAGLVIDEAHRLKDIEAMTRQNLKHLRSKWKFLLTGTPVQNNLSELYSLLSFVAPKTFVPRESKQFLAEYVPLQSTTNQTTAEETRSAALALQLQARIKPHMLRRTLGQLYG